MRIERDDLGHAREPVQRGGQIVWRGRTDVAQLLRKNDVGIDLAQRFGIDAIDAFATLGEFANQAIDFAGAGANRQTRVDHDALVARFRREVTFVADAANRVAQAEREGNLRGRWQQRTNAHRG